MDGEDTFDTKLTMGSAPACQEAGEDLAENSLPTCARWDLTIGQNVMWLDRDGQTRSEQYLNAWNMIFKNTITTFM